MPYLLLVGAVVLLVLILSGCGSGKQNGQSKPPEAKPVPVTKGAEPAPRGPLTRADLQKRLEALAKAPSPTDLKRGAIAMCYSVAPGPQSATYLCPKCGEKTVYARSDKNGWDAISAIEWYIPACRQAIKEIKGLPVELDESQFCRKCSPKLRKPQLVLIVKYPGEVPPHRCAGIAAGDLQLISDFLAGKTKGGSGNDGEYPLKDCTKRLGELLGVKVNDTGATK